MKPKQISLHELPFTEIVKFGTIRLASSDYQHIWMLTIDSATRAKFVEGLCL